VIVHLEGVGLIEGVNDEERGWYAGGDGPAYPNVRFEYLEVYDDEAAHFIPSSTSGGYGATCPVCGFKLDKMIYRLREKWPPSHEKKDMSGIVIPCRSCGVKTPLQDLSFEIDTAMTRFFVMLADAEPPEWDGEFVPDIERVIGCKTRIVMERL